MIRIDDRIGSRDLIDLMPKGAAALARLPYGDAEFTTETGLLMGFEVKTLLDLLNCISTGRFGGHQLPGMTQRYNMAYLIVEGRHQAANDDGVLVEPRRAGMVPVQLAGRRFMWSDLEKWLTTMEVHAGVRICRTLSRRETALAIYSRWQWWGKSDHHAHRVFDESILGPVPLREPSFERYVASRLAGIGWVKSGLVEMHFKTAIAMANADERQWAEIDGIGETLSRKIYRQWRGEK